MFILPRFRLAAAFLRRLKENPILAAAAAAAVFRVTRGAAGPPAASAARRQAWVSPAWQQEVGGARCGFTSLSKGDDGRTGLM